MTTGEEGRIGEGDSIKGEEIFFFFPGVFRLISSNKSFLSLLKLACSNSQVYLYNS